jgi:hypothetical protein
MKSTICIAEDREACEPCLKLLLLSLNSHSPGTSINLFYPQAKDKFFVWVKKCPQVRLHITPLANAYGWNVKPTAIMQLINQGFDEVIWIDSDIIVNRDIFSTFSNLESGLLVVTEDAFGDERDDSDALRARLWGFPVGRVLPFGLNSGVIRATKDHYSLMQRWWTLLQSDIYQESQKMAWKQRPVHMLGDQDVLTALLTSEEFSVIPLHILRRGKHILQFNGVYGYTIPERMRNLLTNSAAFVHSLGAKPWSERWWPRPSLDLKEYIKKLYLDLSPYTLSAMKFRYEMECDTEWMEPHYMLSRILRFMGMGRLELTGLPVAVLLESGRIVRHMQKLKSFSHTRLVTGGQESATKR